MKTWTMFAVVFILGCPLSIRAASAQSVAKPATEDDAATKEVFPAWMAGHWTANPFEVTLHSDFHRSVYGPGARSSRLVDLTIRESGEGVFTVTSRIRDHSGRTVSGTREIDELRFEIGDLRHDTGYQPSYTSTIVKAERRYPDDPGSTFALDGAKLEFFVHEEHPGTLDIRFDTPEGPGSFWETLHRAQRSRPSSRS